MPQEDGCCQRWGITVCCVLLALDWRLALLQVCLLFLFLQLVLLQPFLLLLLLLLHL